jgi:hypothetical protein
MIRFYNKQRYISGIFSFRKFNLKLLPGIFALILILSGCEKGILKLGNDILPNGDMVSITGTDTLSIFSYTDYNPKFRTDNPSISFLGQSFDPIFGTTNAEFVTQIRLAEQWPDSTLIVDSVKLYLRLLSVKGTPNTDIVHTLRMTELSEQIYTDSAYYSNTPAPVNGTSYVVEVPMRGLTMDTLNNFVVELPKAFGEYLIRDTSMLFYSNTRPDFRSYFKGLYFQIDPTSEPLLVSLSIAPPSIMGEFYNAIVLYMHTPAGSYRAFSFALDATNRNAGYNRIIHDYTTATEGDKMIHVNTTYKDTLSYLQGLNGLYTRLVMPGLADLKKDTSFVHVGINKARLTVPIHFVPDADHKYISKSVPASLQLRYTVKDLNNKYDVPDYNIGTSHAFFDGVLDSVNKVYNFNIPAFVQAYLENTDNYVDPEVEIYQTVGLRNVIFEANHSKTPVKFEFTYTKF